MLKRCLLFLCFGWLLTTSSFAQDPAHFIIGEKDFANVDIYTLLYDDATDILYVGTNSGLYAYLQNNFVEIPGPKEQIGNSFFQLKQNKNGHLFCCNMNGQIFKLVEGKLTLFSQTPADEMNLEFNYFFVEEEIIAVSPQVIRRIDAKGEIEVLMDQKKENSFPNIAGNAFYGVSQTSDGAIYIPFAYSKYTLRYHRGKFNQIINLLPENEILQSTYLSLQDAVFSIDDYGKIGYRNRPLYANVKQKQISMFSVINENEILSRGLQKGICVLEMENDSLVEKQSFFENQFISSHAVNENGTLFLGTFGEGIRVVPNKEITQSHYPNHLFLGIAASPNNDVYLSTRGGEVFQYENGLRLIDKIESNVDRIFYIPGGDKTYGNKHKNIFYGLFENGIREIKDLYHLDNSTFVVATLGGVILKTSHLEKEPQNLYYKRKIAAEGQYYLLPNQRYISVAWSPIDSLFYFGNNKGVYTRAWSSPTQDSMLWQGAPFLGHDLAYYKGQLIAGTAKNGVLFFENKKAVAQLSKKDGLKSNTVLKIFAENDLLYLLTKGGMQIYDLQKKEFLGLGVAEGLINDDITNFVVNGNKLWLLEKHRFYALDISQSSKESLIGKLYVDSVLVNDQPIDYLATNQFTYEENKMHVFFDYRDVESKTETIVHYTLEGFYDDWKTLSSTENEIEFQSLPVGNYTFKIKASHRNQTTEPFIYSFKISPPYWQEWWFYLSLTFGGILISTLIFKSILNAQHKKATIRNELNISKLTAIRSQMNPHFIFNALNSVQHLVLKGDVDNSYSFINKFASLIRKTLDYSEKEFITLAEEINLIEVYLTLEKLRFKDDFEFEIIKPDNLQISIPPMLIQPFIENAILHGLLHKKGPKKLKIIFQLREQLICFVEDNGIGRARAKEIKQRQAGSHKSFSLQAIKRRFDILNDYYDGDLGYEYQDLTPTKEAETRTKVRLKIPIRVVRKK